jgi:hypothetical protein
MPTFLFPDRSTEILQERASFPDCGVTVPGFSPALPFNLRERPPLG